MKVLIYTEYFFPIPGGVQTIVRELASGLAAWSSTSPGADAVEVTVVTQTVECTAEDKELPFRLIRRPRFGELVCELIGADVVHLAGPAIVPLVLGLLMRKPVVVEHHGFQVACPNGLMFFEPTQTHCPGHFMAGRYGKCFECNGRSVGPRKSLSWLALTHLRRWLAERATANITPTDWLATILKLNRTSTVYHGVSSVAGTADSILSPSTFAYQGRLVTTKGVDLLLQVAQQLQNEKYDFRLKIIGEGPELESLKSRAAGLHGEVEFLGHVPDKNLEEVLSDVATVVMPSLGGEVFGLVAGENMLRGKLLIVSDLGALREVVGDTGMIFRTGDAESLATCMRKVLENPSLPGSLGPAARARAMKVFDRDSMIQGHVSLYREALRR